ncbi:MAG: bifunctional diaminohydroxyphosphoribosylaminopyrimidine deaminase/5-amino-6-(5-phosphoribosylamino)uracil reductase RibD [Planctomycetota bacterium]
MASRPPDAADDARWMREALALALRGRGLVEPNPRVGALALQDGVVVGRGWHREWGGPHAEIAALAEARSRGAAPDTVVVTLEPCGSEVGEGGKKTGSCARALLEAGVRRVVFGQTDADPRHRGRGPDVLRAAGVELVAGVEAEACAAINAPFVRWLGLDRPWTIAKWAMSLDGKIATRTGDARWISGEAARRAVHALRARVDAVVVGFRTALRDDPLLTVRDVPGGNPLRIVVDPDAALPLDRQLVQTAAKVPTLLVVAEDAEPARCAALASLGVEISRVPRRGPHRVDLAVAWRALRQRGLQRVLAEGGGGLLAALAADGALDQVVAYVAPLLVGGAAATTPLMGEGVASIADALRLSDLGAVQVGDDVALTAFF